MNNPLKKPDSNWQDMLSVLLIIIFVLLLLATEGLLGSGKFLLRIFPIS